MRLSQKTIAIIFIACITLLTAACKNDKGQFEDERAK
jgi:hypothetical protein